MGLGIACVVAAIVGGGVTFAGQQIHTFSSVWREAVLAIFGVLLMVGSLFLHSERSDDAPDQGGGDPIPGSRPAGDTHPNSETTARSVRTSQPIEPEQWHESLSGGVLELELDVSSAMQVFTLLSVVADVLHEKRFQDSTIRRVKVILQELLSNVARHVPDRTAWVMLRVQERYLRLVSIAVCDSGPGIDSHILDKHKRTLVEGGPAHGLLLVDQMASAFHLGALPGVPSGQRNCTWCDVVEPRTPLSPLFRRADVALVRMEYASPKVVWLGQEAYICGAWSSGRPELRLWNRALATSSRSPASSASPKRRTTSS